MPYKTPYPNQPAPPHASQTHASQTIGIPKPRMIGDALRHIGASIMGPQWRVLNTLLQNWEMIVGKEYARHCTPVLVRLAPKPQGGEHARLIVRIPGALAPQFQMLEGQMLQRMNNVVGYAFFEKIIFEHKVGG